VSADDPRYGEEVRRRMAALPGAGEIGASAGVVRSCAGDREKGVEVQFDARFDGDRLQEMRFRAFGCPHFLAGASWLTERLAGASREALLQWDWRELAEVLEVPAAKFGRLLTLQDAVRGIARNWPGSGESTV